MSATASSYTAVDIDHTLYNEDPLTSVFHPRSFTLILGDFDTGQIWKRGGVTVTFFLAAILVGNVCLLNLLIAIISDEFESYMERAEMESLVALGEICQEARVVQKLDRRLDKGFKAKALTQCFGAEPSAQCVCHVCQCTWNDDSDSDSDANKLERQSSSFLGAALSGKFLLSKFCSGGEVFFHYKTCETCLNELFPEHMMLLLNEGPDEGEKEARAAKEAQAATEAAKAAQVAIEQRMGRLENMIAQLTADQAKKKAG